MRKHKLYIDETILDNLNATDKPDMMADTLQLWKQMQAGLYETYMLDTHADRADELQLMITPVNIDIETMSLAQSFIDLDMFENKHMDVCVNIAAAILSECDFYASWNYAHIVNAKTIRSTKIVAMLEDVRDIVICTPAMLIN